MPVTVVSYYVFQVFHDHHVAQACGTDHTPTAQNYHIIDVKMVRQKRKPKAKPYVGRDNSGKRI